MKQQSTNSVTIDQTLVGSIAIIMLAGAGILWFFAGSQNMWTGACLKVGLVMAALWMALPSLSRNGSWGRASWKSVAIALMVALVLTARRVDLRLVIPMLIVTSVIILMLRPRSR